MDWHDLFRALALVMVIEGLMPFAAPQRWREALAQIAQLDLRVLRALGLASMLVGVAILQILG